MSWIMKLWIVSSIFAALAGFCDGIECEFCKKEFTSLGRHRWRYKARVNTDSIDLDQRQVINSYHATRQFENNYAFIGENASIANTNNMVNGNNEESENTLQKHNDPHRFTCYCGKKCKATWIKSPSTFLSCGWYTEHKRVVWNAGWVCIWREWRRTQWRRTN